MIRKLTAIKADNFARRYKAGESVKDIAEAFGCGKTTVYRLLTVVGIVIGRDKTNPDLDAIRRLFLDGCGSHAIAKHLGVDRSTINTRLLRMGFTPKTFSQSMRRYMTNIGASGRQRMTTAAHDAVRGSSQSDEHRCKIAATREARQTHVTRIERICLDMLVARGFDCVAQKAVGRYNVDVAITEPPVAVEIFGGYWHGAGSHAAIFRKRFDFLLDSGWCPVIIWVNRDYPLEVGAIDYIVALAERLRFDKSIGRQEHVMLGNGKAASAGKNNLDYRAAVGGDKSGDLVRGEDGRFRR